LDSVLLKPSNYLKPIEQSDLEYLGSIPILVTATQTQDTLLESSSSESAETSRLSANYGDKTFKNSTLVAKQ
jgi:hypothetical protein